MKLKKIITNSTFFREKYPSFYQNILQQKISQKYAVLRIWIDKDLQEELPFFIFTDSLKVLDSITIYHKMEKSSAHWVEKNGGGIFELHCYALPENFDQEEEIRAQLLKEFEHFCPQIRGYRILYEYLQVKEDFTAFHTNLYQNRSPVTTEIDNLFLAGDWVKIPTPVMLMEAATTSALFAANNILQKEGLQEEPIYSVPLKGIFTLKMKQL